MNILGVRYGHDAGAALVVDGDIVASIAEERLTRVKNDTSFPCKAIAACLEIGGITALDIDCLAIPGKTIPDDFFTFFQIPEGIIPNVDTNIVKIIKKKVTNSLYGFPVKKIVLPLYHKPFQLSERCKIHFCEHHLAHAASAYYTSGLTCEKTLIVTMDGIGDNVSCAIWSGENGRIDLLKKFGARASLGWFYSNSTEALGWRHGSGEWKLMGLAPYGTPATGCVKGYYPEFEDGDLIKPHEFGEFGRWNDHGANHYHGKDAKNLEKIVQKVGMENFAAEVQKVAENQAFKLIIPWLKKEKAKHLCCAGGFFLNVKINQKLWYTGKLKTQWIYPDCGDSGLPVGAALSAYHTSNPQAQPQRLKHVYWGTQYFDQDIKEVLDERQIRYSYSQNPAMDAAKYLANNKVIAWFQGRMEAGPRALGHRSILMSPLRSENRDIINAKVKYREKFRPFCPSVIYECRHKYFLNCRDEEFMTTSFDVKNEKKEKIPAVVHEDGTARPQMVRQEVNSMYYDLIREFSKITGEAIILNTSFNIRGEPIVCNPREAIRCFYDTGLDVLVLGNYILEKPVSIKVHKNTNHE